MTSSSHRPRATSTPDTPPDTPPPKAPPAPDAAGGAPQPRHPEPTLPAPADVLSEQPLTSPSGTTYRVLHTREMDAYDRPAPATARPPTAPSENYAGTARRAAKLSLATAALEPFADVQALVASLVPDQAMIDHQPPITTDAGSGRVAEEERAVQVRAFIYAASRENDNDYHLIVGRDRALTPPVYLTMELSGLPPAASAAFAALEAARTAYNTFFAGRLPGPTYDFYDPPIPVEIEGSLFFDMTHSSGPAPGPQTLKPHMPTIWEVHPISRITFEPAAPSAPAPGAAGEGPGVPVTRPATP